MSGKINTRKSILIVAAHPDDEILGCGGTVARLVQEGWSATTVILGEGKTARDETRKVAARKEEISELRKEAKAANDMIGVQKVILHDFPDNRFDEVPLLDVVKFVEKIKKETDPDIIFTHYEKDLNIDHQVTYQAVITATRPLPGNNVKEIYSFENISSTEWMFPISFSPDVFFDISGTIETKLESLDKYQSEMCEYPHPRSLKGTRLVAENWGMKTGLKYAEAFKTVRVLR